MIPASPPLALGHIAGLVDARLATILDEERRGWSIIDDRLAEAVDELIRMTAGGKRLRAAFCYWAWLGTIGASEPLGDATAERLIIDAGAAFELLQTFALIHDDVMDGADTRRGRVTIHIEQARHSAEQGWRGEPRRYGEGVAILIGDLAHVYADRCLNDAHRDARNIWDQLRIELNLGQYLDMRTSASGEFNRATAQRVALFKSALYTIVRPLQLGSVVDRPRSSALVEQLEAFGKPVGQAFQLRDDLLGVLGDASTVGKPVGGDLREGKPTELVAVALERASADQRKQLERIGSPQLDDDDIAELLSILDSTGAVHEIENRIDSLTRQAIDESSRLPFASEVRSTLAALAIYVAARNR